VNNSTENGRCGQDTARFCVPANAADFEKVCGDFVNIS